MHITCCNGSDIGSGPVEFILHDDDRPWFMSHPWAANYCHWLIDCVSDVWFLKHAGLPIKAIALRDKESSKYINETLEVLGIERAVCPHDLTDWIIRDFNVAVAPMRHSSIAHPIIVHGWNSIRPKIAKSCDVLIVVRANPDGPASDKSRNIFNIEELTESLRPLSVRTVVFERLHVRDQMAAVVSAKAIVAPHGAGLANLMFADPGTVVVEVRSPLFWQGSFKQISEVLGHKYRLMESRLQKETKDLYRHSLIVNAQEVAEFIKGSL